MVAFLKKWKKYFTFAALLSCFVNILQLTFPFYMFTIYGNIVVSYSPLSLKNITVVAFMAVAVLGCFSYLRSRLLAVAGQDLSLGLREQVYSGMVKGSVLNGKHAYQIGLNDLEVLRNYFSTPGIYALFDVPWAPFYLALIYLFHPVLGIIATSGALIMVGLSILQELLIRKSMKMAGQLNIKSHRFVDSFMRNAEVINGMGMIRDISDRFVEKNNRVMINQTKSSYYAGTIQSMIKPLQNIVQVLIYCFGAIYAIKEGFDVGLMVAGSIIMGRGFGPLMQFMSSWRMTASAKESYLRLSSFSSMLDRIVPGMPLPPPKGHVSVAGAGYRIPSRVLLKAVSFELPAGELLGVIGPNGAGKTTLCSLLLGILPAFGGKVYLDGKDIFSWDKSQVGPYIGYLPQEIELFPGTVAQNIARLGPVDMDRVEQAIQTCGIQGLVDSFPQGLSTQLEGDKGVRLSGGQKQLVGLARALYGKPRLLVLDEPTSNLDEQGEQLLVNILAGMKELRNCTCIMVSHKPQLLHAMDKVLVINAGQVAMFGPKDEVFAKLSGKQAAL